jgi:hypothetical protein
VVGARAAVIRQQGVHHDVLLAVRRRVVRRTFWVTTRGSDALLGFAAAKLLSDPSHALIARVPVDAASVGLIAVSDGTRRSATWRGNAAR